MLKNALDWASRPLAESPVRNKPAAVLSSSTGMFGGVWAAAETRKVLAALGARTLEDTVAVAKADERLANGVDAELLLELRAVVDALAAAVEARAAVAPRLGRCGRRGSRRVRERRRERTGRLTTLTKAATTSGSNCEPAHWTSSSSAASKLRDSR